jgi:hypothetical protein
VCSSRIDHASGVVTITTPASWCEVGHTLYAMGSGHTYGISHSDWALRLLRPQALSNGNGRAWGVGLDTGEADLQLAMRLGLVHESLAAEPHAA